jgi:topoisomerase-4 subunit A
VLEAIDRGLDPFKKLLRREVVQDDLIRLTEIKIKRISKYDSFKADEQLRALEDEMDETKHHLEHLVNYTIAYYENLLKKYGKGRERKTEIRVFDNIQAANVAVASEKLYVNRVEGFVGTGIKKDEYVCDCSPLDDIIVFRRDGKCLVSKVSDKAFVGKDILHVDVFKKNDERMTYHLIYVDGKSAVSYAKRFNVTGVTRDKEYDLTKGEKNTKVLYFSANPNSESEVVTVYLSQNAPARKKIFDFDFGDLAIKGRSAQGNTVTKYTLKRILFKEKGRSTIGGRRIWYDEVVGRLNVDERGRLLGSFDGEDAILCIFKDGSYELTNFELINRYEPEQLLLVEKWNPKKPVTVLHYVPANLAWYVKRFLIETSTINKRFIFIAEDKGAKMAFVSNRDNLLVEVITGNKKKKESQQVNLTDFIDIKGWKALGNKLTAEPVLEVKLISAADDTPEPEPSPAADDEPEGGEMDMDVDTTAELEAIEASDSEATAMEEEEEEDSPAEATASVTAAPDNKPVAQPAPVPPAEAVDPAPPVELGTTIEFDVKKEREQKGGNGPQQLSIF